MWKYLYYVILQIAVQAELPQTADRWEQGHWLIPLFITSSVVYFREVSVEFTLVDVDAIVNIHMVECELEDIQRVKIGCLCACYKIATCASFILYVVSKL